ncbi:hypothetical protein BASA84_000161 [Batrachochytrium salamandrivorans]|nr:hypothetical protein BASA84_000161 [Batrachochytrium salamandrivorans]
MVWYIISGKASDPSFAMAEMIGYHLQENLPDFHVEILPKTDNEWSVFVSQMFNDYAWLLRPARDRTIKSPNSTCPLIWAKTGELIGDTNDFLKLIKHNYNYEIKADKELLDDITRENI